MRDLKRDILVTLAQFDIFRFPLRLDEINKYLWGGSNGETAIADTLQRELSSLVRRTDDCYFFRGSEENVYERRRRAERAKLFWEKVEKFRFLFRLTPFLRSVIVTNTLSYDNVKADSDIDLLSVGAAGRLWTARAFLLFYLKLLKEKVQGEDVALKFCPQMFIADSALNIEHIKEGQDYYLYFWFLTLKPLFGEKVFQSFLDQNPWVGEFLPQYNELDLSHFKPLKKHWLRNLLEKVLSGGLGDWLEKVLKRYQLRIIKKTIDEIAVNPSVVINDKMIKLHFNDPRKRYAKLIEARAMSQDVYEHQKV